MRKNQYAPTAPFFNPANWTNERFCFCTQGGCSVEMLFSSIESFIFYILKLKCKSILSLWLKLKSCLCWYNLTWTLYTCGVLGALLVTTRTINFYCPERESMLAGRDAIKMHHKNNKNTIKTYKHRSSIKSMINRCIIYPHQLVRPDIQSFIEIFNPKVFGMIPRE